MAELKNSSTGSWASSGSLGGGKNTRQGRKTPWKMLLKVNQEIEKRSAIASMPSDIALRSIILLNIGCVI